jgi:hypothetical protein
MAGLVKSPHPAMRPACETPYSHLSPARDALFAQDIPEVNLDHAFTYIQSMSYHFIAQTFRYQVQRFGWLSPDDHLNALRTTA